MTQFLPPNLLALFAPRDPIPYLPPVDKLPYQKKTSRYSGIADFLNDTALDNPFDRPPSQPLETKEERQERRRKAKAEQVAYKLEQDIALWRPKENPDATSDPYKTLFVARIHYYTAEAKLRREFEKYGRIKKISIIHETENLKPRGYAFIEFERAREMHSAYKHADGKKIDGRRVLVDVERGRTVTGWLPRRLGGGLGGTRRGGFDVNLKHSGREEQRADERHLNRDRDRAEKPERVRSRSRERRRRSRSRSRDRHRGDRHKRERSHDRERTRDHEANETTIKIEGIPDIKQEPPAEGEPRERRRRSRSRDRDRKHRRSRSRDRKHRDYDRDREGRRERDRARDQDDRMLMTEESRTNDEPAMPETKENFDNGYEDEYNAYNANNLEYM